MTPSSEAVDEWFVAEVLPLEAELVSYLRRARSFSGEADDLGQEVFARVYEAAKSALPPATRPFVFTVARNLMADRFRRSQVVSIELLADLEGLEAMDETIPADRIIVGRQELGLVLDAVEALPDRCRQIVRMRKIEGLTQREVARALGIAENTVEKQVAKGVRRLADAIFGGADAPAARLKPSAKERDRGRLR